MNACIISFGSIESKSNGYFVRVCNIVEEVSRFYNKAVVLEFPDENIQRIQKVKNVTYIRLHGNELTSNKLTNFFKKIITFDPLHNLKFQIFSFLQLWRYKNQISSADIVIIEGCLIPAANIIAKLLRKKVMLDTHGVNKLLAKHFKKRRILAYFLRTLFWDFLERVTMKLSDIVVAVSEKERKFVINEYHVAQSKVFRVPNVVKLTKSTSRDDIVEALRKKLGLESKIVVSFIGDMRVVHNADAVEYIINELAPQVWGKRKDVVFLIIGKGKERFNCNLPNVFFTGFVDDSALYLGMSDICIAPLRVGCGVKTKIMEYLIHGKPIVATFIGAEGLEPMISNLDQNFVRIVSLNTFYETLIDAISNLHKLNAIKVQIDPQIFLERFRKKLSEVFYYAQKV